jgi:outer membrane protein TolC
MPTFRYFAAIGVGAAIALGHVEVSASQSLPSLFESQKNPSEDRDNSSVAVFSRRQLMAPPSPRKAELSSDEDSAIEAEEPESVLVPSMAPVSQPSSGSGQLEEGLNPAEPKVPPNLTNSELAPIAQTPESEDTPVLDPSPATTIPPGAEAPEYLNPSPNPLLFPTRSEEVQVELVEPITLEQAIELAQRNNEEFKAARLTLERTRAALREALAAKYPTASVQTDLTRTESASQELQERAQDDSGLSDLLGDDDDTITTSLNATLELSYDLYTGGRRPASIRAAEEQVRFQQLEVERIAGQLRLNVARAYYDLQQADAQVEIAQAAVTDAARSLRDAQLLEQAGLGTRFDVLQAQVSLANANQDLTRAISQQRIARRRIVQLLSLPQSLEVAAGDPIEVAGDWDLSLEQSIVLAFRNRAELEQQLVQRNISEQQRQIALAAIRPQASLFTNYNILEVIDDDLGSADGFTLGARLRWNFYDGGAARARAEQEEKNIEIAETNFAQQRNQVRFEVEEAFFELNASEENIQTASFALEQAQESLRLARLRFQAGVGIQSDVISQQAELTRARINRLTAILDYNRALAELQRAVSNLPDSILFDLP